MLSITPPICFVLVIKAINIGVLTLLLCWVLNGDRASADTVMLNYKQYGLAISIYPLKSL